MLRSDEPNPFDLRLFTPPILGLSIRESREGRGRGRRGSRRIGEAAVGGRSTRPVGQESGAGTLQVRRRDGSKNDRPHTHPYTTHRKKPPTPTDRLRRPRKIFWGGTAGRLDLRPVGHGNGHRRRGRVGNRRDRPPRKDQLVTVYTGGARSVTDQLIRGGRGEGTSPGGIYSYKVLRGWTDGRR